ncbi:MAG: DUF805 domain-containing protein [Bacteroidota bacterium]
MNWYLKVLRQYTDFEGRARRQEYWIFVLFNMIFAFFAIILDNLLGIAIEGIGWGPLYGIYALAVFIPGLAVSVRRLHDIGKSGWMLLVALIPLIGSIWLLVLLTTDSKIGENRYGDCPKDEPTKRLYISGSNRDVLLLSIVIWICLINLFWIIMPQISIDFYSTKTYNILSKFILLIWPLTCIGLAFTIKNRSKQILSFVIGGLYAIVAFYSVLVMVIEHG